MEPSALYGKYGVASQKCKSFGSFKEKHLTIKQALWFKSTSLKIKD